MYHMHSLLIPLLFLHAVTLGENGGCYLFPKLPGTRSLLRIELSQSHAVGHRRVVGGGGGSLQTGRTFCISLMTPTPARSIAPTLTKTQHIRCSCCGSKRQHATLHGERRARRGLLECPNIPLFYKWPSAKTKCCLRLPAAPVCTTH